MLKRIIVFILVVFLQVINFESYSQINKFGTTFISNYTSENYLAGIQNWATIEDNRGVMYFGNNDCILEFDGITWNKIYTSKNSAVLSFYKDSIGTVFVGAANEFGYLKPNLNGATEYYSLSSKLDSSIQIGEVWRIFSFKNSIYFSTLTNLYKYDYKSDIKIINSSSKDGNLYHFCVDNDIYLGNLTEGLLILKDSFINFVHSADYANDYIMAIINYNSKYKLIATYLSGITLFNFNEGRNKDLIIDLNTINYFQTNNITQAIKLNNSNYFFSTFTDGIASTDEHFNLNKIINKKTGLNDNTCYNLFLSNDTVLWASLNDGISKVEINSAFSKFDQKDGINGSIKDIIRFKDKLFIATNIGLFYLDYSKDTIFQPVKNISTQSWFFNNFNNDLLLVGNNIGMYEVKNDQANIFSFNSDPVNSASYCSLNLNNNLIIGHFTGLLTLCRDGDKWKIISDMRNVNNIISISSDAFSNIWISTSFDGLARITKTNDTIFYKEESGLPSIKDIQIYNIHDNLIFATQKGLYSFNYETEKFEKFNKFGDVYCDGSCGVYKIVEDSNAVWINPFDDKKEWIERVFLLNDGTYTRDTIAFKRLEVKFLQAIYPDKDGIVWFGTADGLISFDKNFKRDYYQPFYALIRKITLGEDSVIFNGNFYKKIDNEIGYVVSTEQPEDMIFEFQYNQNSLTFEYAAPYFEAEEKTEFSVYLEGFDKKWSNWKTENKSIYTNLREGKYIFKVKAKNIYGVESIVAEYKFSISPPWYRTVLAYICYILIAVVLVLVIIKLYTRQLVKDKQRLEKIVEERTVEIRQKNVVLEHQKTELEQQKEEIEAQRDELETQRDELDAQNKIVISQRDKIEKQNHDIKDSITYASRIQNAMIPPNDVLKLYVSEFFILWRPRDIVSGDFYWAKEKDNNLILVVADCTGHGVPGAFMSMLGISLLNEIVTNIDIVKSDTILNKLRENIILSLHQTGEIGGSQDGMDLSMIIVDKENKKVQFSGANNPLVLVRKLDKDFSEFNNDENFKIFDNTENNVRVIDIKADKMPIGISRKMDVKFSCFAFGICEGDALYLFSDGYPDQFGGPTGKKFMIKSLKEIFAEIYNENFENQRTILNNKMEEWLSFTKKDGTKQDQIDDILVMGVKI